MKITAIIIVIIIIAITTKILTRHLPSASHLVYVDINIFDIHKNSMRFDYHNDDEETEAKRG